ncbi:type VI secretion system baseplate subunit TssE [Desulfatitalea alkaliphila]|uniref:Type VI secretion system baseplate subunit TssE n=1 Tax=Desulfatitalea alkaliphila TaxID=2929485 RepID=A0AA41R651_9BACT|nr:type VI secretion system baseplate subunit TssE [Desulfatitalea alkaliphila]MCJ8501790.1 type VI secretion system baseplate subunit TssE [Desulfatitalea alkaliphila]
MREHRLLDRIRESARNPSRRVTEDPAQMIRSVQSHLQRILNTRQGNVPIAEDYGIPDFTDLMSGYPESRRVIEHTIRDTIQKYEPRLRQVRVVFLDQAGDALTVHFQINAQLVLAGHRDPVTFDSVLDTGGQIKVKK